MELLIETNRKADIVQVKVSGEIDVSNAAQLRRVLDQELQKSNVALDLSEAPYIDSTGIGVLVGASARARELGFALELEGLHHNVSRILGILGLNDELNIKG